MNYLKLNYISLAIPCLFIASQTSPDNKLIFISIIGTILSFLIIFIKYIQSNSVISKTSIYIFITLSLLFIFLLNQDYSSRLSLINQSVRILYPWIITIGFLYVINPLKNNKFKLFSVINYSTLIFYLIIFPDIFSILFGLLKSPASIFFIKGFTIVYPESNTTAFLLFFNLIFRNEIGLSNKKEFALISFLILLTISRSTILILLIYLLFKLIIKLIKKGYKNYLSLLIARTLPLLSLIIIFISRTFSSGVARERWQLSFNDSSFQSRLFIIDYIKYVFENLNFANFHKILLGFGWEGKKQFVDGVLGTSGHTLIGMIPELGLIYIVFLILFFYKSCWKGQLAESFILSLSLTIFIPISYVMPIFCLTLAKERLLFIVRNENKINSVKQ